MENNPFYEYLGIIAPNRAVTFDTMDMKIRCKNEYGWNSAIWSKPHFTAFNIIQPALNEEKLIKCLERNATNISPFKIDLYGFDYLSSATYTLYVKLKDEKEFVEMVQYIRTFSKAVLKSVKGYPPRYTNKAHLTIAKGILKDEFMKAWKSWKNTEYQSVTKANRLLLLRRPFTNVNFKYEIIGNYPFLEKGPLDNQIMLF